MPIIEGSERIGGGLYIGEVKTARAFYDFALDGGATGAITLRGDQLPAGAILTDSLVYVDTVPTSSGSATIALKVESAGDIAGTDVISGAPWSTLGPHRGDFTATSAPIKTTVLRPVVATIATAALTAGKFSVVLFYVELA